MVGEGRDELVSVSDDDPRQRSEVHGAMATWGKAVGS